MLRPTPHRVLPAYAGVIPAWPPAPSAPGSSCASLQGGDGPPRSGGPSPNSAGSPTTLYLLAYLDDETYRRRILTQLNRTESRYALARAVFHGQRGQLRPLRDSAVPDS